MKNTTGSSLRLRPMPCELFCAILDANWNQPLAEIELELAWLCQGHFGQMGHEEGAAGPGSRTYLLAHSLRSPHTDAVLSVRTQEGRQTQVLWSGLLAEGASLQDLAFATDWVASSLCRALPSPVKVGFSFGLGAWEAAGRPSARVGIARVERPGKEPFELALHAQSLPQGWELRGLFFRALPAAATP